MYKRYINSIIIIKAYILKISLPVYTQNSDWRPRTEIMKVIYLLFALEKFQWQCLFEVINMSFYLCNLCYASYIAFAEWKWCKHLWDNRNGSAIWHTSNCISNRISPSSKSNKWTITFSVISLIFDINIHGRQKKCVTKTLFTNFTRRNCFPKYGRICSLFWS